MERLDAPETDQVFLLAKKVVMQRASGPAGNVDL